MNARKLRIRHFSATRFDPATPADGGSLEEKVNAWLIASGERELVGIEYQTVVRVDSIVRGTTKRTGTVTDTSSTVHTHDLTETPTNPAETYTSTVLYLASVHYTE